MESENVSQKNRTIETGDNGDIPTDCCTVTTQHQSPKAETGVSKQTGETMPLMSDNTVEDDKRFFVRLLNLTVTRGVRFNKVHKPKKK